jgi:RecB family exonuclease
MPNEDEALRIIAEGRRMDPLAPVTVVAPSHLAALQLRRRLAEMGPFAGVRFEPLPRLAELLAAGELAAAGRVPLARPIGDYVAEQVAREARGALSSIADLQGFARMLRQMFRRLRRGGITSSAGINRRPAGHMAEVLRLYDLFRSATSAFYDEEDLLDEAARIVRDGAAMIADMGSVLVFPRVERTAGSATLIDALGVRLPLTHVEPMPARAQPSFVLAPDAASEAREAVREVIDALESGLGYHEVAMFYGADRAYRPLLAELMEAAGVPAAMMPGTPLVETRAGRGLLALIELPAHEYGRTKVMDALALAPLRARLPVDGGDVAARVTSWDRLSREAGITRGTERWRVALEVFAADQGEALTAPDLDEHEGRREIHERMLEDARNLGAVVGALIVRLDLMREEQPADRLIVQVTSLARDYLAHDATGLEDVLHEVEQLGTVEAVGGRFSIARLTQALRANLEAAHTRERGLGDGVLVADYRSAAGLRFKHVVLCGAREGSLPAGPGEDALVEDSAWSALRERWPYVEDAALRIERSREAAERAVAAAAERVTWCAPLYEAAGAREFYPSSPMVRAAQQRDASLASGSALRLHPASSWLRRGDSPLSLRLAGHPVDASEVRLREAVVLRQQRRFVPDDHRRRAPVAALRARMGGNFTAWDGNLAGLSDDARLQVAGRVSPTSLEAYAMCGFRYFGRSVLRLNVTKEPEERETIDRALKGNLVHRLLERFFRERQARGRPRPGEAWTDNDRDDLFAMLDELFEEARARGQLGMELFAGHERRALRADLAEFLQLDNHHRLETGAVPSEFECGIPPTPIAGVVLRGIADRIDRSQDGRRAWVIDYKTGGIEEYEAMKKADPLVDGRRLQLPAYLLAVSDAEEAHAFYWFITQRGGFQQISYEPTPDLEERFVATLEAIAGGVTTGAFPAQPDEWDDFYNSFKNCRYCDFDRICARRREEAFAEKRDDPAMDGWLRVGRAARGES